MHTERRSENRSLTMFKAAYIEHDGRLAFVTLRDISSSGVCFSGLADVNVGDRIAYCIDDGEKRNGSVIWVESGRFGVKADDESAHEPLRPMHRRPRSVRLPIHAEARVFTGVGRLETTLHNLSLRGTCISDPGGLYPGQLLSLEVAGECFELTTVKWIKGGRAGVHFAQPLRAPAFNALLDRLQNMVREESADPEQALLVAGN